MLKRILSDNPGRQALDRGADAGGAESFVVLAPADRPVVGRGLDEMVIPPACIAGEKFDFRYFG